MKKILLSFMAIALVSATAIGATKAYFSDTVTSNGNTIAAQTLQLNVDGLHSNDVKFNITNIHPNWGPQPETWKIQNVGTMNGFLNIKNITVNQSGGVDNVGNLGDLVKVHMFVDNNGNGWYDTGDTTIYDGYLSGFSAAAGEINLPVNAGSTAYVTAQIGWWNNDGLNGLSDNAGQGDSAIVNLTYELDQVANQ